MPPTRPKARISDRRTRRATSTMTSHFRMVRRCLWPGCGLHLRTGATANTLYCTAHYTAIGPELQERLRTSYGTGEWIPAVQAAQDFARQVNAWVRHQVTGGKHVDSHA